MENEASPNEINIKHKEIRETETLVSNHIARITTKRFVNLAIGKEKKKIQRDQAETAFSGVKDITSERQRAVRDRIFATVFQGASFLRRLSLSLSLSL